MKPHSLLLSLALLAAFSCTAQCTISGKSKVCLGDMATYELSGSGIQSVKWKFGNGYTSNDLKARHLYKKMGSYTLSCEATLSSGGTCTDTLEVEVLGLPKANFARTGSTDSCQFTNNVCFEDKSQPAATGQNIVKRLVVWGDGGYDASENPAGEPKICRTYITSDVFKIKFEITDIFGCKQTMLTNVNILKGPEAIVRHSISEPICGTGKICFINESKVPDNASNTYNWVVNGYAFSKTTKTGECYFKTGTFEHTVRLIVNTAGGCSSEFRDTILVDIKPFNVQIDGNSTICYNAPKGPQFWVSGTKGHTVQWSGSAVTQTYGSDTLRFSPKSMQLQPGTHTINALVSRGGCSETLSMNYTITGPVAAFSMSGRVQCEMKKKIYMWDESQLSNQSKTSWRWLVTDNYGDDCISWRSQGQNLYKNCRESKDWYHKHSFDTAYSKKMFAVHMWIHDSITGCSDSAVKYVKKCCPINFAKCNKLPFCQGDRFTEPDEYSDPEVEPISYSLDTGKTFYPFHSYLDPKYVGIYGVLLVWKKAKPDSASDLGNDSIQIFKDTRKGYDTLFYPSLIEIIAVHANDKFDIVQRGLKPKRITIIPQDPNFNAGDRVQINWGDGSVIDTFLETEGRLDSFVHIYDYSKFAGIITINMQNKRMCKQTKELYLGWGLEAIVAADPAACGSKTVCFEAFVKDNFTQKNIDKTSAGGYTFTWDYGDSIRSHDTLTTCHTYTKPGKYNIKFWVRDSLGQQDSGYSSALIQEIVAGIMPESKEFFCSEIKQLLDSSALVVYDPSDKIEHYYWDFGQGTYTTIEKNPYHSFDNGGSYTISHVVKSSKGCTDTATFSIIIKGSQASFDLLGDSVGCAPFLAHFNNTSKNCRQYIWEYGDPDNNTHSTTTVGNDTFRYYQSGRFEVRLIGIDTFYNSFTGNAYYCNSYYPNKDSAIIVTVLPSPKTGLTGPDTICVGTTAKFTSLSQKGYEIDAWQFLPDRTQYKMQAGSPMLRRFNSPGVYTVALRPYYTIMPGQPRCFDSAKKTITVLGVQADFDIDPSSVDPVYHFKNNSTPKDAAFKWNFGQPSAVDNESTETNPSHDYYPERNTFKVCLTATIPAGCIDTTCNWIDVRYFEDIKLANVFTPNEDDALNRDWDIIIDGERLYDLRIYNRWGELVFESKEDAERGATGNWNGRVMNTGADCPEGSYFYEFTFAFSRGNPEPRTVNGSITLIR